MGPQEFEQLKTANIFKRVTPPMSQYYYRPFPLDVLMLIERQGQYVLMYINCLDIICP